MNDLSGLASNTFLNLAFFSVIRTEVLLSCDFCKKCNSDKEKKGHPHSLIVQHIKACHECCSLLNEQKEAKKKTFPHNVSR